MGKFDNKMVNTGKPLHIFFSKWHIKVAILVESDIAKMSGVTHSLRFVILSNKKIKVAKPR